MSYRLVFRKTSGGRGSPFGVPRRTVLGRSDSCDRGAAGAVGRTEASLVAALGGCIFLTGQTDTETNVVEDRLHVLHRPVPLVARRLERQRRRPGPLALTAAHAAFEPLELVPDADGPVLQVCAPLVTRLLPPLRFPKSTFPVTSPDTRCLPYF